MLAAVPDVAVVVLTTFDEDAYAGRGAAGRGQRLPAQGRRRRSSCCTRSARWPAGNGLLDPAVTLRVIAALGEVPGARPGRLRAAGDADRSGRPTSSGWSPTGYTNAEIAAALFLGEATVKTYLSRMLTKLGPARPRAGGGLRVPQRTGAAAPVDP